jgi:hypothetical protein
VLENDPQPYAEQVQSIEILRSDGPLHVSTHGESCRIAGGQDQLQLFADNVTWLLNSGEENSHLHFEYFPGHLYIHESAEPLLLRITEEASA